MSEADDQEDAGRKRSEQRHAAVIRGRIAFWSVIIYLGVGSSLMLLALLGLGRIEDAIQVLQAFGSYASLVVGAAIGFYFGSQKN